MAARPLGVCTYCRRDLTKPGGRSKTARTSDHVMPQSVGGRRKVRCCRQCNSLKGDIHPSVWRWFTEQHPGWWRLFRTNGEVVAACRPHWGSMVRTSVTGPAQRSDMEDRLNVPLASP